MIEKRESCWIPLLGLPLVLEVQMELVGSRHALAAEVLQACEVSPPLPPPTSEHFVIGASGRTPIHHTKLDWRTKGARIQMLLPRPQLMRSPCGFSNLPYDVTTEQALTYPEVRAKLEASMST